MRLRVMRVLSRMNVGGPAVQACVLQRLLDPARFEQRLYTGTVDAGEAEHVALRGINIELHRVPGLGRRVDPTADVRALTTLVTHMRRFRPHIVHTHAAKAGTLGRLAARLARVPLTLHTYHGHLLTGYFGRSGTAAVIAAERFLAPRTDRLIAVGARVRDDLLSVGIGAPGQYVMVAPGTSLPAPPSRTEARRELDLPPDAPVIAFVGRVAAIKRPDRLLEMMRLIRAELADALLVVCGDGPLAHTLQAPWIRRLGWRADVQTVYAAADLAVLVSDNEGMPVSLIEAGLAGVPVVATTVGSVAEVVRDGITGSLCPPSTPDLAAAALRLLRDTDLRRRMGGAAREWAGEQFSAARLAADIDEVYTSLAESRGLLTRERVS